MTSPVQIKVFFGLLLLTKRSYLLLCAAGTLLMVGVWVAYQTVFAPGTWLGTIIMTEGPWFYDVLPWVLYAGVVLELIEVLLVLRRFRQREAMFAEERFDGPPP